MGKSKRIISMFIIISLLFSLIPAMSFAAGSTNLAVTNLSVPKQDQYKPDTRYDVPIPDETKVSITRKTSKKVTVEVEGTFDQSKLQDFYYSVTSVKPNTPSVAVPVITDKALAIDNQSFQFQNVVLYEGLNKIVVYTANGEFSTPAAWVYYTSATTITNLKIDNRTDFSSNIIITPETITDRNANFIISGEAPNADTVSVQVVGDQKFYTGFHDKSSGYFQFIVDKLNSTTTSNLKLQGGDQKLLITATNDSQKTSLARNFVYNDGTPFIFMNKIAENATSTTKFDLIEQPVIEGSNNQVYLEGYIKVDKMPDPTDANKTVLKYNEVTIKTTSGASAVYDLTSSSLPSGLTLQPTTASLYPSTENYNVYKYTISNLGIDQASKTQKIISEFRNTMYPESILPVYRTYFFDYINTNDPYISSVIVDNNFTLVDGLQINELPVVFSIKEDTTSPARLDDFYVYYDGVRKDNVGTVMEKNLTNKSVKIKWLPEGVHQIKFVPVKNGVPIEKGALTRTIQYIPMQYIIMTNIYHGQVFTDYTLNSLEGKLVNVPSDNTYEIYINGYLLNDNVSGSTDPTVFNLRAYKDASNTQLYSLAEKILPGKNEIKAIIRDKDNRVLSESNWDIYFFTVKSPSIELDIDATQKDNFVYVDQMPAGQYVTKERSASLKGKMFNADTLVLTVYRKGEAANDLIKVGKWSYSNTTNRLTEITTDGKSFNDRDYTNNFFDVLVDESNGSFNVKVDLSKIGTTTIQAQVTNDSGITNTKTIEIVREPLPYDIIYPNLQRTNVVNSNFVRIEMIAEGADEVLFGKEEPARRAPVIDRQGNVDNKNGFVFDINNLKKGKNKIKFSVVRGEQTLDAEIEIFSTNTNIEGATYKTEIGSKMKIFNGLVELKFPKDTMLRRNDDSTINPYLSNQRQILFGIAEDQYGRVDKFRHPMSFELRKDQFNDGTPIDNFYPPIDGYAYVGRSFLMETTGRFRAASPLIWIDAGVLKENEDTKDEIIYGSGQLPYDSSSIFYYRDNKDQIVPTNRGEITLQYNKNMLNNAWPYLTVYRYIYNPTKGIYEWENIGGIVDTKKNTITAPFDGFGYYRVMYMHQSFDDVIDHSWARYDLDTLYSKGIMTNMFVDQFRPEENISRGEFVTLIVKGLQLPLDYEGELTFYDVQKNPYFVGNPLYDYRYIETAARYGIIRGHLQGTFAPNQNITREDAAAIIVRALNLKTGSTTQIPKSKANLQKLFTDANLVNEYAILSVEAVVKSKLMAGKPNVLLDGQKKQSYRFEPKSNLKRSEAAGIIMNILRQQKKVPK